MHKTVPWKSIHFTGIGGVGMTGLALILRDLGVVVAGSDMADSKRLHLLRARGVQTWVGHNCKHVKSPDVLIFSSAVTPDNPERREAELRGIPQIRRGDFLAILAEYFTECVCCSGTHGKTTTSAMLAHILITAGREPGYLIGGDVVGLPYPACAGNGQLLVTEVDESDGTQAAMHSSHAIITNVEDDHCWSVGGVAALQACFQRFAQQTGCVLCWETELTHELFDSLTNVRFLNNDDIPKGLALQIAGEHNRVNATLAIRMAEQLGLSSAEAVAAMNSFRGVDRRQSIRFDDGSVVLIEDYAHHPTEVRATIQAIRERFPEARLRAVFQPHRFERIARYLDQFCLELGQADEVVVTPPFAAWVDDAALADPRAIATGIKAIPARYEETDYNSLAHQLASTSCDGDVIAVMGAGSITNLIQPLTEALGER